MAGGIWGDPRLRGPGSSSHNNEWFLTEGAEPEGARQARAEAKHVPGHGGPFAAWIASH